MRHVPPRSSVKGFITRTASAFDNVEDERKQRIQRLAGACRIFGKACFSEGLLGHLTARDPEHPDPYSANPLGGSFNRMRVSDIVQVDHRGHLIEGDTPVNPVGVLLRGSGRHHGAPARIRCRDGG